MKYRIIKVPYDSDLSLYIFKAQFKKSFLGISWWKDIDWELTEKQAKVHIEIHANKFEVVYEE